jgi:ubiquinone/menaquinone biosynthesis C-methylase UbiE
MDERWSARMRRDWDQRAREDWMRNVLDNGTEDEEAFFESGRHYMRVHEEKYLPQGVKIDPEWKVLDVGCGVGRVTFAFGEVCREVIGTDVSPEMIDRADRFNRQRFHMDHVRFLVGSGHDLSVFENETFDLVYCGLVLGHVPTQEIIAHYLEEFHRVLKPGGYCIAMTQDYGPIDPENPTGQGTRFGASELYGTILERGLAYQVVRTSTYGHLGFWFGMQRHPEGLSTQLLISLLHSLQRSLHERERKLREYLLEDPARSPYGDYVLPKENDPRRA